MAKVVVSRRPARVWFIFLSADRLLASGGSVNRMRESSNH